MEPTISCAFQSAKISRAIWRLSCPVMVSSFGSPDSGKGLALRLRLLQPEPHVHLAVHRRGLTSLHERSAHSPRRNGIVNVKVEPAPTWLVTPILPPCNST